MVKPSSPDHLIHENKEIVRKRRPINFSLNDLGDDETKDKNWNAKEHGFKSPKADSTNRAQKIRILPQRFASSKIKLYQDITDEETDEDDILEANQTPAINKQTKSGLNKVLNNVVFSV